MPPQSVTQLCFIDATGYNFVDYPTVHAWLIAQYQVIYGSDVYIEPDSQDGQFLAFLAQAFYDTFALGASVYNSFSPVTAQGVGLARVVKINGLTKQSPSFSTVTVTIVGTAGTVITNGYATDTLGQQWNLPTTVTIPGPGTIDVTATAAVIGFVTADTATITTIGTPTLGWQTVNNAAAALPGGAVETDAALRIRQIMSTSLPALTPFQATLAAVGNVTGVTKTQGYENYTDSTDGNSLPPHSICVVVVGGNDVAIATAIMSKKTPGTNPFGNHGPITVSDGAGLPVPISFSYAIPAEIQATVNVTTQAGWNTAYEALIQAAVSSALSALPIGAVVYPSSLYVPALLIGTPAYQTFYITSIAVGKNGGSQSSSPLSLVQGENAEDPISITSDITVNPT